MYNIKNRVQSNKKLTQRETEVLRLVMKGLTNKEIAEILMITHHTVKAHIASAIRKLNVRNRLEASMLLTKNENYINPHQD